MTFPRSLTILPTIRRSASRRLPEKRKGATQGIAPVVLLGLLGNDLVFDLVVGRLRNNLLSNQFVFLLVRTILYYLF